MIESNMWYNVWFHKNQFCHKLCQNWCQNWCHIWYHYLDLNISPSLFSRINSDFFQKKPKIAHFWYCRKSNETGIIFELKKTRFRWPRWYWWQQNVDDFMTVTDSKCWWQHSIGAKIKISGFLQSLMLATFSLCWWFS